MSLHVSTLVTQAHKILNSKSHPDLAAHMLSKLCLKMPEPAQPKLFWLQFSSAYAESVPANLFLYPLLVFTLLHKKNPLLFSAQDLYALYFYYTRKDMDPFEKANLEMCVTEQDIQWGKELLEVIGSSEDLMAYVSESHALLKTPVDTATMWYAPPSNLSLESPKSAEGFYFHFLNSKQVPKFSVFPAGWLALLERAYFPFVRCVEKSEFNGASLDLKRAFLEHLERYHIKELKQHINAQQAAQWFEWMLPVPSDFKSNERVHIESVQYLAKFLLRHEFLKPHDIPVLLLQSSSQLSISSSSLMLLHALALEFPRALHFYDEEGASVAYHLHEHIKRLDYHKNSLYKSELLFARLCELGMDPYDIVLRPNALECAHTNFVKSLIEKKYLSHFVEKSQTEEFQNPVRHTGIGVQPLFESSVTPEVVTRKEDQEGKTESGESGKVSSVRPKRL